MATGMLEDNSSFTDGNLDFELIGSDYFPSQKTPQKIESEEFANRHEQRISNNENINSSSLAEEDDKNINKAIPLIS